jgi:hypothetical protein
MIGKTGSLLRMGEGDEEFLEAAGEDALFESGGYLEATQ